MSTPRSRPAATARTARAVRSLKRDGGELAALALDVQAEPAAGLPLEPLDARRADLRDAQPVGHEQPDDGLSSIAVLLGSNDQLRDLVLGSVIACPRGSRGVRGTLTPTAGDASIAPRSTR